MENGCRVLVLSGEREVFVCVWLFVMVRNSSAYLCGRYPVVILLLGIYLLTATLTKGFERYKECCMERCER